MRWKIEDEIRSFQRLQPLYKTSKDGNQINVRKNSSENVKPCKTVLVVLKSILKNITNKIKQHLKKLKLVKTVYLIKIMTLEVGKEMN